MVLPEGFVLPPWYLLVPLLAVLGGVVALLWALDPPVTDRTVLALTPWMMFGATLHVLHRFGAYPDSIEVLFATPTVYLITATGAGLVWVLSIFIYTGGLQPTIERVLGTVGTGFFVVFTMFAILQSLESGTFEPFWSVIAVVAAGIATAIAWLVLGLWFTDVAAVTATTGVLVIFGHALDAVSTAIGYDVLNAGEEVPLSALILNAGSALPTAEFIGAGWLFVVVKVALVMGILGLFREFVEDAPRQARLLLAFIAAVGFGPGIHNVILFAVA
ncbi:DUF63 family protein [Natrialba asiatica]|uniref:DUF63 domain-containing protein n=1 Tax=Natrialba asiatica (strain ATCC 700177 / DSM 12278 / JCM 9576 / FERM P-10747 / NBRC 102637 / 172P1) TaxID=29540 RepID=M0AKR9_NATA1|nr:DUF63 family protein [Natrialba asiatica]ELY99325.1 hypothetical protein C481_15780 [Natrialba asiatica DSM 12278]